MSVCWLIVSDGRDEYHEQSLASMRANLPEPDCVVHVDDREHRLGFAGAVQEGWGRVLDTGADWVFHGELDFIYNRPVLLSKLIALLKARPELAQVALRRQPVGAEIPHGGFMAMAPEWYEERSEGGFDWVQTRRNFTTNPSLYRADLCGIGWPDAPDSEGYFGFALKEDCGLPWGVPPEDVQFGFWGSMRSGSEWVMHIGKERQGVGY